jgi:hypothetical protein
MQTAPQSLDQLALKEWKSLKNKYESQMEPWVEAFRQRRISRQKHPVHDFLFEYYQCKRRLIAEWHPPINVILIGDEAIKFLTDKSYTKQLNGIFLDPTSISSKLLSSLNWIGRLIEAALARRSQHHCYGLHEWAMVYKSERIRHENTPLRLSPQKIEKVIESHSIYCTHYDAFRFFTESAKPINTIQPSHEDRRVNEQFGCVHFNMDLFKWCYKLHPWISSELLLECFQLAVKARELDMRASPYDLREYGYDPICIETSAGRAHYQEHQKHIGDAGRILASILLKESRKILRGQNN